MRSSILLLVLSAAVISSCSSAYKTGQTPDDVYFSPERQHDEYVRVKNNNDDRKYQGNDDYYDDRYLRMKVRNRAMWSDLDDWYFYDRRYSYSSYNNWNNPWSPNTYWNYYYNPYCGHTIYTGYAAASVNNNHPRIFNLSTYNNNQLTNNNYTNSKNNNNYHNQPIRVFNSNSSNNNSGNNVGNTLRSLFGGSNSNSSSSGNSGSNSSGSSSGGSSSSSGSSGSSAPVRKF